jgi:hypothetical protein
MLSYGDLSGMKIRRIIARWTALIVLMNVGLGFCECLREDVPSAIKSARLGALTPERPPAGDTSCGDNCETCVCHASIVIVERACYGTDLAVARLLAFSISSFSDSDCSPVKHPPRLEANSL